MKSDNCCLAKQETTTGIWDAMKHVDSALNDLEQTVHDLQEKLDPFLSPSLVNDGAGLSLKQLPGSKLAEDLLARAVSIKAREQHLREIYNRVDY